MVSTLLAWALLAGIAQAAEQKLTAFDGAAGDQFGFSVAFSDGTSIVGARGDDESRGSAYVFVGAGLEAKLTAPDAAAGDQFGRSVAIEGAAIVGGNTAIVGAPFDDGQRGSAYVFVRSGSVWMFQEKLTANDGLAGDQFGASVAVSGDTAFIGAPGDRIDADEDQGSAYVFVRSPGVGDWAQHQKLTTADGVALDFFGASAALEDDTAIVGAPGEVIDRGSAYVYVRSGDSWALQQRLTPTGGASGDRFGGSVALSLREVDEPPLSDTVVIGAWGDNSFQGSAHVFIRNGSTWEQQQILTAADGAAVDQFGLSVSVSGDIAVVGAPNHDLEGNDNRGAAYAFVRAGDGTWTQAAKRVASDSDIGDHFGSAVASGMPVGTNTGDTAVIGASDDDVRRNEDQGSAYLIDHVLSDPSHDVGIAGGGFRTAGRASVDSTREIVIKIKNFGDHAETQVPFDVASADGPSGLARTYSAACSGDAAALSDDGDLDAGEVVSVSGCTVTYGGAGEYSHTLTVHHGEGPEELFEGNPENNTRTRSTTVVP